MEEVRTIFATLHNIEKQIGDPVRCGALPLIQIVEILRGYANVQHVVVSIKTHFSDNACQNHPDRLWSISGGFK
jgi:hypothetical protein